MTDSLQCIFDDARRRHLRDDVAMTTAAKVAWFKEMVELIVVAGAIDRLVGKCRRAINAAPETP